MTPEERREQFIKEYGELREKLKLDLTAIPVYVPNEKGTFELAIQIQVVDIAEKDE